MAKSNNIFHIPIVLNFMTFHSSQTMRFISHFVIIQVCLAIAGNVHDRSHCPTVFLFVLYCFALYPVHRAFVARFEFGARTIGTLGLAGLFLVGDPFSQGVSPVGGSRLIY